jgi:hypothetical protein
VVILALVVFATVGGVPQETENDTQAAFAAKVFAKEKLIFRTTKRCVSRRARYLNVKNRHSWPC